jgi:hypothetical protein
VVALLGNSNVPLSGLQSPLQRFIRERILLGAEATPANIESAALRVADDWYPHMVSNPAGKLFSVLDFQKNPFV